VGLICGDGEDGTLEEPDSTSAVATGCGPVEGAVMEPPYLGVTCGEGCGPVDGAVTEPPYLLMLCRYVEESCTEPSWVVRGEPGVADRCKVRGAVCMVSGAVMEPADVTVLLPNVRTTAGRIAPPDGCTIMG